MKITKKDLLDFYYYIKLTREYENRMIILYRQGMIKGVCGVGRGQEALSVGTAYALKDGDMFNAVTRNHGAMFARLIHPKIILAAWMGKAVDPLRGKDIGAAYANLEYGLISPSIMMGSGIPTGAGIALAFKMRNQKNVYLTYIGDGGTSIGDFHEGLNFASVHKLPLIVVIENNGYAYSTPTSKQYATEDLYTRAAGYGIYGEKADGNDVVTVYETTSKAVEMASEGKGPVILEFKTFRMKGHAEHDDAFYVPKEKFEYWKKRDPVLLIENHINNNNQIKDSEIRKLDEKIKKEIEEAVEFATSLPFPSPEEAAERVYAP